MNWAFPGCLWRERLCGGFAVQPQDGPEDSCFEEQTFACCGNYSRDFWARLSFEVARQQGPAGFGGFAGRTNYASPESRGRVGQDSFVIGRGGYVAAGDSSG